MIGSVKKAAARAGRKAALGLAAITFLTVGLAFLTAAAWMMLSELLSAYHAAAYIGMAYFGIGLIILGISASRGEDVQETHTAPPQPAASGPPLVSAFLHGLNAGAAASAKH